MTNTDSESDEERDFEVVYGRTCTTSRGNQQEYIVQNHLNIALLNVF